MIGTCEGMAPNNSPSFILLRSALFIIALIIPSCLRIVDMTTTMTSGEVAAGEATAGEVVAGEATAGEATAGEMIAGEATAGSVEPSCGNNLIESGEDCDDGNQDDGDGCSTMCEFNYMTTNADAPCALSVNGCPQIEWVEIRGGSFQMGSPDEDGVANERPQRLVNVPSFLLMKTEVTVSMYRRCVEAGHCTLPPCALEIDPVSPLCNYTTPDADEHPLNYVTWHQLMRFAAWVGARLPSESEWEYAARSEGTDHIYPWGNEAPMSCELARLYIEEPVPCGEFGTAPPCGYPSGNTEQGVCDMAGNLFEWVLDEWRDSYTDSPEDGSAWCSSGPCPLNADDPNYDGSMATSNARVMRGGSHGYPLSDARTRARSAGDDRDLVGENFGGRLARSLSQ